MLASDRKFMKSGIITLVIIGSAVAAFGLTFHFFGQSEIVPGPSRQFGFWALAPVGIIDQIAILFTGERVHWYPVPMFFIVWIFYSAIGILLTLFILRRRAKNRESY